MNLAAVGPLPIMAMDLNAPDVTRDLVFEVLKTGLLMGDLLCEMAETMADQDAYPGEDPHLVALEMLVGTCRASIEMGGRRGALRAIDFVASIRQSALADLEMIEEMSGGEQGERGNPRREGV